MEQIECDICGGENKPGAECDNFICPNYEPNRTMKDTYDNHTCHDNCPRIACMLRRELTAMTEQRDGLLSGIDYASEQLSKVTEQRDRLAEALKKAKPIVSRYPSGWDFSHDELDAADSEIEEALQSLTPTQPEPK